MSPAETVVLAVFRSTRTFQGRLAADAFKNPHLRDGDVSLMRLAHTDTPTFDKAVIAPKAANDPVQGVVICVTGQLRGLSLPFPNAVPAKDIRAICVIDKVELGDPDGHAALQYCEDQDQITNQGTKAVPGGDGIRTLRPVFVGHSAIDAVGKI